jgi:hypothetical protein
VIDFAQESRQGERAGKVVDSVILVEHSEVERTLAEKGDDMDVQAMGVFIISNSCRRLLMSQYLGQAGVSCGDVEPPAGCDRCGDGTRQRLDEEESSSREWQQVQSTSCAPGAWRAPCSATPNASYSTNTLRLLAFCYRIIACAQTVKSIRAQFWSEFVCCLCALI